MSCTKISKFWSGLGRPQVLEVPMDFVRGTVLDLYLDFEIRLISTTHINNNRQSFKIETSKEVQSSFT